MLVVFPVQRFHPRKFIRQNFALFLGLLLWRAWIQWSLPSNVTKSRDFGALLGSVRKAWKSCLSFQVCNRLYHSESGCKQKQLISVVLQHIAAINWSKSSYLSWECCFFRGAVIAELTGPLFNFRTPQTWRIGCAAFNTVLKISDVSPHLQYRISTPTHSFTL